MSKDDIFAELENLDPQRQNICSDQKRCNMCEEPLYKDTILHVCAREDSLRQDLVFCPNCIWVIHLLDGEPQEFTESLCCICEDD